MEGKFEERVKKRGGKGEGGEGIGKKEGIF